MRKWISALLLVLSVGLLTACGGGGLTTEELAEQVKASMLETWAEDPGLAMVEITSLELVHVEGNSYKGIVKVDDGVATASFTVKVTSDGKTFMWELEP